MPEQIAAPAGEEIEIAIPFGVPDERAFAADQVDRVAVVVGDDVSLEQLDRVGGAEMVGFDVMSAA